MQTIKTRGKSFILLDLKDKKVKAYCRGNKGFKEQIKRLKEMEVDWRWKTK